MPQRLFFYFHVPLGRSKQVRNFFIFYGGKKRGTGGFQEFSHNLNMNTTLCMKPVLPVSLDKNKRSQRYTKISLWDIVLEYETKVGVSKQLKTVFPFSFFFFFFLFFSFLSFPFFFFTNLKHIPVKQFLKRFFFQLYINLKALRNYIKKYL